ncbi:MAG TPA: archaeosortase/exosortase family protein [Pyrinomonadaceae bacterium]|jgi:exosortase/archaeosortase family protein|nr:archaeosortase/exosortase family protein [Pyrinomonadaceae bacterium]
MKRLFLVLALQVLAFWEVWYWYVSRAVYSWDQPWGILAFVAAVLFLIASRKSLPQNERSLLLPALLVLLYAATYFVLPSLFRATIAFTAVATTMSLLRFGRPFHAGLFGLLYLSLPTITTLQFFGGYPLRVIVAELTAPILRMAGFAVVAEGTCLNWAGQLIWIDAPCSGIKMLWVGLFLTFVVLCFYELPLRKTLLLIPLVGIVIMATNIFRAVALFYIEGNVLDVPSWSHEYAGVIAFVLEAAGIVAIVFMLRKDWERTGARNETYAT